MPDLRLTKTRASLPDGYQFGDAAPPHVHSVDGFDVVRLIGHCRCGARYDAHIDPKATRWFREDWNVIEGEHFASDADPIVMCSCANFMTCEHPWPQIVNVGGRA